MWATVKTGIPGSYIYETKTFQYVVAGIVKANIGLMIFGEGRYGVQAQVIINEEIIALSINKHFETTEAALEAMIQKIEDKLAEDPWVKEMHRYGNSEE